MKLFKLLFFTISVFFLFSSCQKELDFETSTIATGSLKKDAGGSCLPSSVNGIFEQDFTLNSSNFIDIVIDAAATGSYKIVSDTSNGYSFKGTGVITLAGLNNIRLIGSGTPVNAGTSTFVITFGTTTCRIAVTVLPAGSTAVYTLTGDPGPCVNMMPSGLYTATVPTNSSNVVTVEADVTSTGAYSISTSIVNGVSFTGTGFFTTTGSGKIMTLVASGTPLVSGTFAYPITGRSSMCSFSITYGAITPPAAYTINCTGATAAGLYMQGIATTSANTLTISATPTSAGTYTISTTAVNGVTFSATGTFTTTVTQPVILTASGTPTVSGPFTYPATATPGGSTCSFSITYDAPGCPSAPPSTDSITAKIDGVYTTFKIRDSAYYNLTQIPGYNTLIIFGDNNICGDETFTLAISLAGTATPVAGNTYTVNSFPGALVAADYTTLTNSYQANTDGSVQSPAFSITITSITSTKVTGTFSGPVSDGAPTPVIKTITSGTFSVPIY